jgi:hypothetical protein
MLNEHCHQISKRKLLIPGKLHQSPCLPHDGVCSLREEELIPNEPFLFQYESRRTSLNPRQFSPIETADVTGKWVCLSMEEAKWYSTLALRSQGEQMRWTVGDMWQGQSTPQYSLLCEAPRTEAK